MLTKGRINGNVYKLAFWLVAHLAWDPKLLGHIQQEVLPAMKGGILNEKYLLDQCPKLASLVDEILRLAVSSSLARVIMEPTVVGGKTLQPGNKIMVSTYPYILVSV
jgi:cytochrome P450